MYKSPFPEQAYEIIILDHSFCLSTEEKGKESHDQ